MDSTTLYCLLANELEIAGMQAQSSPRALASASVHKRQHTESSWSVPSPPPGSKGSSPSRSGFLAAAAQQEANNNSTAGGEHSGSPDTVHHLAQLLADNPQMRSTALRLLQQQHDRCQDSWQAAPAKLPASAAAMAGASFEQQRVHHSPHGSFSRASTGVRQVPQQGACTTACPQDDDCSLAQLAAALNQRVEQQQQAAGWEWGPRPVPAAPAWQQCERGDTSPGRLQLGDGGAAADGNALVDHLEQMLLESLGGATRLTPQHQQQQQHNEMRSDASSHGRAREHQRAPPTMAPGAWASVPLPSLASGGIVGHQQPAGEAYPTLFTLGSLPELPHAATHGGGNTSQDNSDCSFSSTTTTRDDGGGAQHDAAAAMAAPPVLGRSASATHHRVPATHHRVTARRRSSHGEASGCCRAASLSLPLPRLNCLPDAAAGWGQPAEAGLLLPLKRANSIDADELFLELVRGMAPQPHQLAAAAPAGGAWIGY